MKTTFKTILILALLLNSILNGICQNRPHFVHKDYIIKYENIEFNFEDSIYPFTVFIEPNGYFYFMTNFVESSHPGMTTIRLMDKSSNVNYVDTFVKNSNEVLKIESYYPKLIKHDSSIINHYSHEMNLMKLIRELEYSYINYNLKEPNLYKDSETEIIRVIAPEEYSGVPRDYSAIRLDLKSNKLFYSKGVFDKNTKYKILETDSCLLKEKDVNKVKEIIDQIDFEDEYYFTELGLDYYPKFLIEYKTGNNYYVLERDLSNNRRDSYPELYFKLFYLHKKYIKQK
ncbi:hypothetical protein ACFLSE_08390 [Bacteroidota bacterium]